MVSPRSSLVNSNVLKSIHTKETLKGLGLNENQILALNYVMEHDSITMSEFRSVSPYTNEWTYGVIYQI